MNGTQCDTCRVFVPGSFPESWLVLLQQAPASPSPLAAIFASSGSGAAELAGAFCSLRCLAEFAYVRLAAEGAQDGTSGGTPPGAGGWVG